MKRQRNEKSRTEAVLSVIIITALVLTLALTVAGTIKKNNAEDNKNIVDLNETEGYSAQLENETVTQSDNTSETKINTETDNDYLAKGDIEDEPLSDVLETEVSDEDTEIDTDTQIASHTKPTESDDVIDSENEVAVDSTDNITNNLSFSADSTLFWPVTGDIVLKYNMDSTIWFPTLGVYKCNPAIYISSETGTKISSACTGVVESIYENEETGTNVVVSIGNGYKLTYGQVENAEVVEGDIVKAGDTIGYVAEPSIYHTEEGAGLYFKVECNEESCDPMMFLE